MSLQLVYGGAGSGKSTYVFEKIIAQSLAQENKQFLVLVPEQFTMQTQMDLVRMHPKGGILNIDVCSFMRLAHKIGEEVGQSQVPILDDTGKSLILRRLAAEYEESLPLLGSRLKKIGYIHEVKSAISEFMQYGIGPKELEELVAFSKNKGNLSQKLQELLVLYQAFMTYTKEKYITTEEIMDRLYAQLDRSKSIRDSVIVLDGFTGFTPIQNRVIEKLLSLAKKVYITVTLDSKQIISQMLGEQNLFALSQKTIYSLTALAEKAGVAIDRPIVLDQVQGEKSNRPDLLHLEKGLFRYPYTAFSKKPDHIHLYGAKTVEEEVHQAVVTIRSLLREGYEYRDIAVICGDLGSYGSLLEEEFAKYNIPGFFDQTKNITLNPFVEYIRSAWNILLEHFSYPAVFQYLRSGMADFSSEEVDRLENYCIAFGIKGKKWQQLFVRVPSEGEEGIAELAFLNGLRERLLEQIAPLQGKFGNAAAMVEGLYGFLEKNRCSEKLQAYEQYFQSTGEPEKEKEYSQIYTYVLQLLEQLHSLLGTEKMNRKEFLEVLDAGFGEIQVGVIPQRVDTIVVGDVERTRLKPIKALLLLGMNDGNIPKNTGKGGILSDIDREFLATSGQELAPTPRQEMFIQRFYFYLHVTKPSEHLYLSYSAMGRDGKGLKLSYFVEVLKHLFPGLETEEAKDDWKQLESWQDGRKLVAKQLRDYKVGTLEQTGKEALFTMMQALEDYGQKDALENLLDKVFYAYTASPLSKEAVQLLYGSIIRTSISRLGKMAWCAYSHYLEYGLGLEERKEYGFEAVDMGILFHSCLDLFGEALAENHYTWLNFPPEEGKRILETILEKYALDYGNTVLFSSGRNEYVLSLMRKILNRTIETLQYQLKKGRFMPKEYEVSFSLLEDLDSITISLNAEEKMRLRGRIDRIDTWEEDNKLYVKVVDYKSGNTQFKLLNFYYGLDLQLVMYLNAAVELEQKKAPGKEVIPAAILYYHLDDPMIESDSQLTEQEIQEKIYKNLSMTGVINSNDTVLKGLDQSRDSKSDVVPVSYNKDGSVRKSSAVMEQSKMQDLMGFAIKRAKQIGTRILEGDIAVTPREMSGTLACQNCNYRKICGFDETVEGYQRQSLEKLEEDEIFEKIQKGEL